MSRHAEGLGAAAWGGVCATGGAQSPIDLPVSELTNEMSLMSGSKCVAALLLHAFCVYTRWTAGCDMRRCNRRARACRGTNKFGDIQFKYRPNEQTLVMNTGHGTMQVGHAAAAQTARLANAQRLSRTRSA